MDPTPNTIHLFMWGYQPHFRITLEILAERTLSEIAPDLRPKALLVGIRHEDAKPGYPICIEPEDGPLTLDLFANLDRDITTNYDTHPDQNTIYGDAPSMQRKPSRMKRDAIRDAVKNRIRTTDDASSTVTFAGNPTTVGDYDVVPILQVNKVALSTYPRLTKDRDGRYFLEYSFLHATIRALLAEATKDLQQPEPGSAASGTLRRDHIDILREAGRAFMRTPAAATFMDGDLFEAANLIASLYHERAESHGRIIVAKPSHEAIRMTLHFNTPIPLSQGRWARKALQLTAPHTDLVTDSRDIIGLGEINPSYDPTSESVFSIDITGHYSWDLRHHDTILLRTKYGVPGLPKKRLDEAFFRSHAQRRLAPITPAQVDVLWTITDAAAELRHGTTVVITPEAVAEAIRLRNQGTAIKPCTITTAILPAVSHIDGAILLDTDATCHAIGVILDGKATDKGTAARGARYNAAIRYTQEHPTSLALVISDDGTAELVPTLRPQITRSTLDEGFTVLRQIIADRDLKHALQIRNWLDNYRFYLNADRCDEANKALPVLQEILNTANRLWLVTSTFTPNPEMNDSYFLRESETSTIT